MENPWKTRSVRITYDNRWIQVTHREVVTPSGTDGIYGVVHFKNLAVGVVPLDEALNTWLVGQYRYTLGQYSWEIPEGGCPLGDDPLDAARRELAEETGIRAEQWDKVLDLHTSNSVTDETGLVYVARGLSFGEAEPEETEELSVRKLPFDEALEMVFNGQITDALSQLGLMRTGFLLQRGELPQFPRKR